MAKYRDSDFTRRSFVGGTGLIASTYFLGCRPRSSSDLNVADKTIVRAAIHPAIGVCRIGNSKAPDGYFIGPEVIEPEHTDAESLRDSTGALKRQVARFRVYGLNAKDQVVAELTPDNAEIEWQVHLANKKADWYRFIAALDALPEAETLECPRRNPNVKGKDRSKLIIDPGPRKISGKNSLGNQYHFSSGKFLGNQIPLGELRTDELGRLLVFGGQGQAGSPEGKPVFNPKDGDTFNNADGWFDDISDGPVTATVTINGKKLENVDASWVIVAPPNYAPNIIGWRTFYDLLTDTYAEKKVFGFDLPKATSFTHDVLPTLKRLENLQWVNQGFALKYGKNSEMDFSNLKFIQELNKQGNLSQEFINRKKDIYASFRQPDVTANDTKSWPWLYGDAYGSFKDSPKSSLSISKVRALHLKNWFEGKFISDYDPKAKPVKNLSDVPLNEQPDMLDMAALHYCLADAFHPGCEMTWPMRHVSMYSSPFRLKHKTGEEKPGTLGEKLTSKIALSETGPLHAQGPGDVTKWMAIPWQGDTVFCRSGYEPELDPYILSFWPARVPNQVLSQADYAVVMNEKLDRSTRMNAFNYREHWLRKMQGGAVAQMLQMLREFSEVGFITAKPGPQNDPDFPPVLFVENIPGGDAPELIKLAELRATRKILESGDPFGTPRGLDDKVKKAGWENAEQLQEFKNIRMRTRRRGANSTQP